MKAVVVLTSALLLTASPSLTASQVPPSLVEKLVELSGSKSQDCGAVPLEAEADAALACAETAVHARATFRVAIEYQGIDSIVWAGVAIDRRGQVWTLYYDSYGSAPNLAVKLCDGIYFEPLPKGAIKVRDFPRCKATSDERPPRRK